MTEEWRRSSYCAAGDCIEVTIMAGMVVMRCTQFSHPRAFGRAEWDAFVKGVKAGEFDDLTGETP
jgi:hypothetical protein